VNPPDGRLTGAKCHYTLLKPTYPSNVWRKKGGELYFSPITKKLQACTLTVYPTQVDFLGDYISVLRGAAHQMPHFAMRYNP